MNCKRKSRRRFFLLMRWRTPPISSKFRGGFEPPKPPPSVRHWFIRTQALLMRATRSARISTLVLYTSSFSLPHKQNGWSVSSFYHFSVTVQNRTHVHMNFLLRITHTIISQSTADSSWITLYTTVISCQQHMLIQDKFIESDSYAKIWPCVRYIAQRSR